MTRYTDILRDTNNVPIPGASIYVFNQDGTAASLTDDNSNAIVQPLKTDAFGAFTFNVPFDGLYPTEFWFNGRLRREDLTVVGNVLPLANVNVAGTGFGLFTQGSTMTLDTGISLIATTGYSALDKGGALYVYDAAVDAAYVTANPRTSFISLNGRGFRLSHDQDINVLMFGAVGDGVADDSAAILAAVAYMKSIAGNLSSNNFYKASPRLLAPAGRYNMGNHPIDITHVFQLVGEGSGRTGAAGATEFAWSNGVSGIRIQNVLTSGDTTVDGVAHLGAGVFTLKGIKLLGGYGGTESNSHAIDPKAPFDIEDVWIDSWSGEGINGLGNIATNQRNISASSLRNFRVSNCRIGFNPRGPDANIINVEFGEFINNRQAGYRDDAGIGSNNVISCHFSGNGMDGKSQTSIGGNRYAVKVGQESGASTNAPKSSTVTITIASPGVVSWTAHGLAAGTEVAFSTTGALPTGLSPNTAYYVVNPNANDFQVALTSGGAAINTSGSQSGTHTAGAGVDNTWWLYIEPGAPSSWAIAWTNGLTWRAGGDIIVANDTTTVKIDSCYFEDGTFQQFGGNTLSINGQLSDRYYRGGARIRAGAGQLDVLSNLNFMAPNALRFNGTTAIDSGRNATLAVVTCTTVTTTGLAIGSGTPLTKAVVYTPSLTPSSVAAATVAEQTFTVTGVTTADKIVVNPPSISNATGIAGARVSAADTVAIRFVNPTAGSLTPTSGTYTMIAFRS